ncbi:MAG: hypothetical protein GC192_08000 [Bacteroidetes bacterium]|nr:hypothetical protein [Bacteroidota bacterium]
MINIRHPRLQEIAERHYQALMRYLDKHNYLHDLEEKISVTVPDFDFKKVILASPEELEIIVDLLTKRKKVGFPKLGSLYTSFSKRKNSLGISAVKLIEDLDLSVCPYCNRNFIYNTDNKRPSEIDHFHAKSKYPLLAMSFYNLVPSCKVCNHFKNDAADKKLINPYDTRYDWNALLKFRLKVTAADFYFNAKSVEVQFENLAEDKETRDRVRNTISVFELEDQYKHHRDFVIELIQKKYLYSDDYLNALYKQYEGTIFRNREDILRLVTTNFVDEKDLKNRPLAKLTKDIVEQLDL